MKNQALWAEIESGLKKDPNLIELKSLQLIFDTEDGSAAKDPWVYRKITLPIISEVYGEVEKMVKAAVEKGEMNNIGGMLPKYPIMLRNRLLEGIVNYARKVLNDKIFSELTWDTEERKIILMVSLYYACYLNAQIIDISIPEHYFKIFIPLLTFIKSDNPAALGAWSEKLIKELEKNASPGPDGFLEWEAFFTNYRVKKVIAQAFSTVMAYLVANQENLKIYLNSIHKLGNAQINTLMMSVANGFHTVTGGRKRFVVKRENKADDDETGQDMARIDRRELLGIINQVINAMFMDSVKKLMEYEELQVKKGKVRSALLAEFQKTPARINSKIWSLLQTLKKTRERELLRKNYLMRILIYYAFETQGRLERGIWIKYVELIERLLAHVFANREKILEEQAVVCNTVIEKYRGKKVFSGTDWDGFYKDPESQNVAIEVFTELVNNIEGPKGEPTNWFTHFLQNASKGRKIDYSASGLLNYFRSALKQIYDSN